MISKHINENILFFGGGGCIRILTLKRKLNFNWSGIGPSDQLCVSVFWHVVATKPYIDANRSRLNLYFFLAFFFSKSPFPLPRDEHPHDADEAHGTRAASHARSRSSRRRSVSCATEPSEWNCFFPERVGGGDEGYSQHGWGQDQSSIREWLHLTCTFVPLKFENKHNKTRRACMCLPDAPRVLASFSALWWCQDTLIATGFMCMLHVNMVLLTGSVFSYLGRPQLFVSGWESTSAQKPLWAHRRDGRLQKVHVSTADDPLRQGNISHALSAGPADQL